MGTMNEFNPGPAASMLANAWRTGSQLKELPAAIRPTTLATGYDVQDRLIEELAEPVAGWKLGVGSHLQKRQSGVGRSIAGRVLRSRLYGDRDVVPLPCTAAVTVEFEIAYVLGRDILPDEAPFPVLEAVAEVRTSTKRDSTSSNDRRAVGWPSFAADNGAFHALVLGDRIEAHRIGGATTSLTQWLRCRIWSPSHGSGG
jgi:2-keto-4-pentenoate hydratase